MPTQAAELVFDEATKLYEGRGEAAVDRLSLTVPAGEICVLVGPSGGGKTTALKLVNRLIALSSGDIRIDGTSIMDIDLTELRRSIGYVIQQVGLFPHMTVGANIGTVPRLLGWPKRRIELRTEELLELVGLVPEDAKRYPAELSGGQRQRVGLARALAANPPLMLMDEPFGAIDPIIRSRLQDEFLRLQQELRKTVVFVTHDIDEAIKIGDRIAILREGGRLAQYDSPAAILEHPADEFVAQFVGGDRALKALALRRLSELELRPAAEADGAPTRLRGHDAARRARPVRRREDGVPARRARRRDAGRRGRTGGPAAVIVASGPVIPNFGQGSSCEVNNGFFCTEWVREHWHDTLEPALVQHIELALLAVVIGFAHRLPARAGRPPLPRARRADRLLGRLPLHDPEPRALPAARAVHGHHRADRRDRARLVHAARPLPQHDRGAARRSRGGDRGRRAARASPARRRSCASSCRSRRRRSWRACGSPRCRRSRSRPSPHSCSRRDSGSRSSSRCSQDVFKTEIFAAGALAVALALAADGLLHLLERALTPWTRGCEAHDPLADQFQPGTFVDALRFIVDNVGAAARTDGRAARAVVRRDSGSRS